MLHTYSGQRLCNASTGPSTCSRPDYCAAPRFKVVPPLAWMLQNVSQDRGDSIKAPFHQRRQGACDRGPWRHCVWLFGVCALRRWRL